MTKLYLYVGLGLAIIAGLLYYDHQRVERGRELERQIQEKENAVFRERLRKGARDFDACHELGGVWDFKRPGSCQLPGAK